MSAQVNTDFFYFAKYKKKFLGLTPFLDFNYFLGHIYYKNTYALLSASKTFTFTIRTTYSILHKNAHRKKKNRSSSHFDFHKKNNPIPRQSIDETVKKTHKSWFFFNSCTNLEAFHCNWHFIVFFYVVQQLEFTMFIHFFIKLRVGFFKACLLPNWTKIINFITNSG